MVYQIYPRSFRDSNGDGVGDLAGIIERLDYVAGLGIDAVWLSPVYPSPMADFGYDVADFTGIDPLFGTLADFDRLVTEVHRRGLKLIMDFVPNHTSEAHPWFVESRASRNSPKRDWYIWRDAPNNWQSEFGGPAWTRDEVTGQSYYHAYLPQQPDLNWRNPEVRAAMHDAMRFWLKRGVDGFRLDTIEHLIEDARFTDNPSNPDFKPGDPPTRALLRTHTTDQPEIADVLQGLRDVADEFADRVLIGETYLPMERFVTYFGHGVHLPFNFGLINASWNAAALADLIARYESLLTANAWPNWVLGNHDRARIASRVGPDQARIAAMLLLTLRGTPTLYYGDELGLADVPIPADRVQDPWEKRVPGFGLGRDPVRTPMPWDGSAHAGFSHGVPWLPLNADAAARNVAALDQNPGSILSLYRRLLALRRTTPALTEGACSDVASHADVLSYRRGADVQVFLNLGAMPTTVQAQGRVLLSTSLDREGEVEGALCLRPHEGLIFVQAP